MNWALVALLLALLSSSCRPAPSGDSVELSACRLDGLSVMARCGSIEVPEDRSRPDARLISLRVAVVPAQRRGARHDPLFLLVGGPGQAATEAAAIIADLLVDVRKERDIVLVDQRGTGGSNPLDCGAPDLNEDDLALPGLFPQDEIESCLADLDADPRFYTTEIAMADLDRVREALGYEQINLWGGSYGSRAALVYLRNYPKRVRTVMLDGVVPFGYRLPLTIAQDSRRAIDLMLDRCARDETCAASSPEVGEALEALLDRLETPITVEVRHPRTGRLQEVEITRDGFASGLLRLLYSPALVSLLPRTISRAAEGDFGPFFAQILAAGGDGSARVYVGKLLSVACAEDLPFIDDEEIELSSRGTFLGDSFTKAFKDACSIWPHGEVPADFHEPFRSEVPALILSGELDPVTPPRWGEVAAQSLPSSRHLVAQGASHGVIAHGCMPKLVAEFLEAGTAEGLDPSCVTETMPPAFFHDFAGPRP